jgi:hypothetical protein
MANTFFKIRTVTVGAGGAATIEFTSIPQTYTDLQLHLSGRDTYAAVSVQGNIEFNGNNTTQYLFKRVRGSGSAADSYGETGGTSINWYNAYPGANATASVFSNNTIYIPNYTSANNKSFSIDTVTENNATEAYQVLWAAQLSNIAAITSIKIYATTAFAQYSTATLYGIKSS